MRMYRDRKDTPFAFIERDLATGTERVVIRRRALGGLNISPDGQYIATPSVDESTNSRTYLLVPVAGGEPRELMRMSSEVPAEDLLNGNKGVWLRNACWAPDSRSVLAFKGRGGVLQEPSSAEVELWQIPIDGSAPRRIDGLSPTDGGISVHPDGRRVAFTANEKAPRRNGEIWALEHFLPTGGPTR